MLVLSRYAGESIKIQNNITMTVLEICGNQIRLGFEAPSNIEIHRTEVFERIQAGKQLDVSVNNLCIKKKLKNT